VELNEIHLKYQAHAEFLFVYIAEAHCKDEWPIGDHIITGRDVMQSYKASERVREAVHFQRSFDFHWPLLVDPPELGNPFMNAYAAWPTRFYIIQGGIMKFIAIPHEDHLFYLEDLRQVMDQLIAEAPQE